MHCLPATLWQQWFERQSLFRPQPVQPVGMPLMAIAAVGAAMLVIRGTAATAAPVIADLRNISRRERPS